MRLTQCWLAGAGVILSAALAVQADAELIGLSSTGTLISIDTTTGAETTIGATGFSDFNSLAASPTGSLYSVGGTSPKQLISINPATGAGTAVAPVTYNLGTPFVRALAMDAAGNLYATDNTNSGGSTISNLYKINATTGVGTLIGNTGLESVQGLDFSPSGTLYAWSLSGGFRGLATINPVTGAGTMISTTDQVAPLQSLAYAPDGTLWGSRILGPNGGELYQIDPTTGVASLRFSHVNSDLRGLEYLAPVPLPAAFWLFGSGLATMVGFARKTFTLTTMHHECGPRKGTRS